MIALTETPATTTERTQTAARHVIDRVDNLPPGSRKIVDIDGRSIGVLNVDGRFFGLRNTCPHHGAPLCEGVVRGTMSNTAAHKYEYTRHNELIACPWHGYEFVLETGRPLLDLGRLRVRTYQVEVENGEVVIYT